MRGPHTTTVSCGVACSDAAERLPTAAHCVHESAGGAQRLVMMPATRRQRHREERQQQPDARATERAEPAATSR
jgi:hypothetical protein